MSGFLVWLTQVRDQAQALAWRVDCCTRGLEQVVRLHQPVGRYGRCEGCGQRWPCTTQHVIHQAVERMNRR